MQAKKLALNNLGDDIPLVNPALTGGLKLAGRDNSNSRNLGFVPTSSSTKNVTGASTTGGVKQHALQMNAVPS